MASSRWNALENGAPLAWITDAFPETRPTSSYATSRPAARGVILRPATQAFLTFILMTIILPQSVFAYLSAHQQPTSLSVRQSLGGRAPNSSQPLEVIQVSPPVLSLRSDCQQTLMVHTFGYSYGKPFVGDYKPPNCTFNRVTFNLTVTSAGRQYDRLALMFFNDTEIFRTSTAEPTQYGISWTYIKDMTTFLALFQQRQKIIFDLGNLVDDTYTGSFYTTLTATFFTTTDTPIDTADVIIPVSRRQSASNSPSGFTVPEQKALNTLTLPRNVKRAVFSISACGQATEEFWWSNVLSSDSHAFGNDTALYGASPFRELQLVIDGVLAGVAWPFPVIFTGGVAPGFWRPVVGIDAYDLQEDEIDITPFLPLLSDGKDHSFEIRVVGIADDGAGNGQLTESIGSNWVVTGKLFLWLDSKDSITSGSTPELLTPAPSLLLKSTLKKANTTNATLEYIVKAKRFLSITSIVKTSKGSEEVTWTQNLTYSNSGLFTNGGNDQTNDQATSGVVSSSNDYSRVFNYPLWVYSTYDAPAGGNVTIYGKMNRGKSNEQIGQLAFLSDLQTFDFTRLPSSHRSSFEGTSSSNYQNGTASYLGVPAQKRSYGSGTTEQNLYLYGIESSGASSRGETPLGPAKTELYHRHVLAANDTLIFDDESLTGTVTMLDKYTPQSLQKPVYANVGIRAMLGRGPA